MTTITGHFLGKEHGKAGFSAESEPVLRITPGTGERIAFETSDAVYAELHEHHDMAKLVAQINPVTGPVFVEGAAPDDILAVTIHEIRLKDYAWSVSMPSYAQGGNMDLTDCRPGSVVYLPVAVDGALLSIGNIHAMMAEGESSFIALEAEGVAVISVELIKALSPGFAALRAPQVETEDEWVFVGLGHPVQESITRGYEDVFMFLVETNGWTKDDAYAVMSAVVHSRLGGPTGSENLDPLHPFVAVGAVTVHRLPKSVL